MKKIIGIVIVVVLALWGLVSINNQKEKEKEPLPRNDFQQAVAYTQTNLDDGDYRADLGDSFLTWKGETAVTHHYGTLYLSRGDISVIDSQLVGEIIFDIDSIRSEIGPKLDDHLKSSDFFDAETYPEASMSITGYINNEIQGELTIRDITQPVSIPVLVNQIDENIIIDGSFSLDRTLWGVEYNSLSLLADLGDSAIRDSVQFEVSFIFEKIDEQ